MEKENIPFNEEREKTENILNEKNDNLTSDNLPDEEKSSNKNKSENENSYEFTNNLNIRKEKDIESNEYVSNNNLIYKEVKNFAFSNNTDNEEPVATKVTSDKNENFNMSNLKNKDEKVETGIENKIYEMLEENLEKQMKNIEENTKSIFTLENKIKKFLNEENIISYYKDESNIKNKEKQVCRKIDEKKNEVDEKKLPFKESRERENLENRKKNLDTLINGENKNEVIAKENKTFESSTNEKEKEEEKKKNEKNIFDELFYDSCYEEEDGVDIWNGLGYTFVDDIKLLNIDEEENELNKFNIEKETSSELKKKKLRKRLMKNSEKEEENKERNEQQCQQREQERYHGEEKIELETETKKEKEIENNKTEECDDKKNKNNKEGELKQLSLNSIDKSFIQVPLKCILNTFRNIQKELEKNIMIITLFIEKKLLNLSDDVCMEKLNTIIQKLKVLKNKVNESKLLLNKYIKRLVNRLKYIYFEADIQLENLKHDFRFETYENRINWLIDGYLSRYGYFETEEVFCKRYKLKNYSDADVYKEYLEIINELKNYNTKPALEWCQKYKSQLKKIDANIESELHLQHVINLIFEKKFFESIEYIKKNVSQPEGYISSDIKYIITQIGLNTNTVSLKAFNEKRWKKVIKLFKKVYSEISGILNKPLLELLLKAGISVIKTEQCGKKKSTKCPTCIDELKSTINSLPHIQKTRSFLVCPYTNEVMDENNPPFTTPAGHVYSEKAISLFLKSDDLFECPITEEKYRIEEFSRLFM